MQTIYRLSPSCAVLHFSDLSVRVLKIFCFYFICLPHHCNPPLNYCSSLDKGVFVIYLSLVAACHISAQCRGGTISRKRKANITVYRKTLSGGENEQLKLCCYAKWVAGKPDGLFLICFLLNFSGLHFNEKALNGDVSKT